MFLPTVGHVMLSGLSHVDLIVAHIGNAVHGVHGYSTNSWGVSGSTATTLASCGSTKQSAAVGGTGKTSSCIRFLVVTPHVIEGVTSTGAYVVVVSGSIRTSRPATTSTGRPPKST